MDEDIKVGLQKLQYSDITKVTWLCNLTLEIYIDEQSEFITKLLKDQYDIDFVLKISIVVIPDGSKKDNKTPF